MTSTSPVSVEEYLRSSYRPDCDFLDGELRSRNLGERPHAKLQQFLIVAFSLQAELWKVVPLPEQRVQVRTNRFRIPDITVVRDTDPDTSIVTTPPLLCIEILSSDDTLTSMQDRVNDYTEMGVQHTWVLDPWSRQAFYGSPQGYTEELHALTVPNTAIHLFVTDLFARLDRK